MGGSLPQACDFASSLNFRFPPPRVSSILRARFLPPFFAVSRTHPTDDLRVAEILPLIQPALLMHEFRLGELESAFIEDSRKRAEAILTLKDDRLLVVVGPCSIHDTKSALEYAQHIIQAREKYAADLEIVMRVYFEKPRTVVGWKGLINDPDRDGTYQINRGLRLARRLLADVTGRGLPVATEFLDTTLGQYYADLVSWGAIGARTVESQIHRELASGLSMPVGFKNRTDGDIQVAVDAIRSARHPHWFPSLTREGAPAVMGTTGNDHTHIVLRGGSRGPNCAVADIRAAAALLAKNQLPPHVMVDCSHANSGKDPARQPAVAADLAAQIAAGETALAGVMLESNLLGGTQSQQAEPLTYGQSNLVGFLNMLEACLDSWHKIE